MLRGTGLAHEAQLLTDMDGPAVAVENRRGSSPVILVCEHASNVIPGGLGALGLEGRVLASHAAYDIGALPVALRMSALLDATLVRQRFSRLVYDCNRPPQAPDAMPVRSEIFEIPANAMLSEEQRAARTNEIYRPFHDAVGAAIEERLARHGTRSRDDPQLYPRLQRQAPRRRSRHSRRPRHPAVGAPPFRLLIMGGLRRPAQRTLWRRRRGDAHPQASRAAARIDERHVRDRQRSHRRRGRPGSLGAPPLGPVAGGGRRPARRWKMLQPGPVTP